MRITYRHKIVLSFFSCIPGFLIVFSLLLISRYYHMRYKIISLYISHCLHQDEVILIVSVVSPQQTENHLSRSVPCTHASRKFLFCTGCSLSPFLIQCDYYRMATSGKGLQVPLLKPLGYLKPLLYGVALSYYIGTDCSGSMSTQTPLS